jgi:hypothetical protein
MGKVLGYNPIPNDQRNGDIYTNTETIPVNFNFDNSGLLDQE